MSPNPTNSEATESDVRRRFLRLTVFNIAANLTVPLTGLVDTGMLGRLDRIEFLAGVALASLVFDYLYFGLGFLRMSTTGLTAQEEGRGQDSSRILWRSLLLALILGTVVLLLSPLVSRFAFALLSGAPEVEVAGRDYFGARIWGAPAQMAQLALVGWLLGRERSGAVFVVLVVANLSNVLLNWLFIMELGLAAAGAGWASALAQTIGALGAAAYVWWGEKPTWTPLRELFTDGALAALLRLNSQIFVRTLLLVTCFAVFTNASARLGTVALAANAILLRWVDVLSYLVDGAAYAIEAVAGRLWGAGRLSVLRRTLVFALIAGCGLGALVWVPFVLFSDSIVGVFTIDESVARYATTMAPWLAPLGVFGALAYILDGFTLGLGRGRELRNSMLWSAGACLALLAIAVSTGSHWLLWMGLTILMASRALTLGLGAWRILPTPETRAGVP